jgi:glycolate oxidase
MATKKTAVKKPATAAGEPTDDVLTTTELVALAKQRLPEAAWEFIVGGAETETTMARNRHALDAIAFRPRVLRNVENASPATTFLQQKQRLPVLLAPIASLTDVERPPERAREVFRRAERNAEYGVLVLCG